MKSIFGLAIVPLFLSSIAFATVDSYVSLKIPVAGMNEDKVCLITTIAHDGISNFGTKESLAMNALNGPFKIYGVQAGEDAEGMVDANMLSGKGINLDFETDPSGLILNRGELTIDASGASAKASTLDERSAVIKLVKIALVAGLENTLSEKYLKLVKVNLKGLPDQTGVTQKLPTSFASLFASSSPFLKKLKNELKVVTDISKCN